jgi:predicted porin
MKKTLIALAAVAATSAFAQSSVTLYGVLDIGYKATEQKAAAGLVNKTSGVHDGGLAGPRIGFRGTEDLGGGLKANFVIEQGLNLTTGNLFSQRAATAGPQTGDAASVAPLGTGSDGTAYSTATNRQSYIGLEGGFGEVRAGYQYNNAYTVSTLSGYSQGAEGLYGADAYHTHGVAGVGGTRGNGLTYISPAFAGGFKVTAQYGFQDQTSDLATANAANTFSRLGLLVAYNNGPVSVSWAHTRSDTKNNTAGGNVSTRSAQLNQLGGSFDFGVAKVGALWNVGNDGGTATSGTNSVYKSWQVGVTVPFGKAAAFVNYGTAQTEADNAATKSLDDKGYQLGLKYSLSKRTTAYALYGSRKNDAAATTSTVDTRTGTMVGVSHSF